MVPRMCREPAADLWLLVRAVVVHHQVNVQILRHIGERHAAGIEEITGFDGTVYTGYNTLPEAI